MEIAGWTDSKFNANSFERGHIIKIIELIESGITRQSWHTLNSTHLIQNPFDHEIHVEFKESPYLRWQIPAIVKYLPRYSASLGGAESSKIQLLRPILHVWTRQPLFWFSRGGMPQSRSLENISEFCLKERVRGYIDLNLIIEYIPEARSLIREICGWNWQRCFGLYWCQGRGKADCHAKRIFHSRTPIFPVWAKTLCNEPGPSLKNTSALKFFFHRFQLAN